MEQNHYINAMYFMSMNYNPFMIKNRALHQRNIKRKIKAQKGEKV